MRTFTLVSMKPILSRNRDLVIDSCRDCQSRFCGIQQTFFTKRDLLTYWHSLNLKVQFSPNVTSTSSGIPDTFLLNFVEYKILHQTLHLDLAFPKLTVQLFPNVTSSLSGIPYTFPYTFFHKHNHLVPVPSHFFAK